MFSSKSGTKERDRHEAVPDLEPVALAATDRCDRCGAQAYVQAQLPGGLQLLFCKHHGRLYADAMKAKGLELRGSVKFPDEVPV